MLSDWPIPNKNIKGIITTETKKDYDKISPEELELLVKNMQNSDAVATEKLCMLYKGLIYKEACQTNIRNALGEDAVNTAWVIFLETVMSYNKTNFKHFPGYVKKTLHYELLHKLHQSGTLYDCDSLELTGDDETTPQYAEPRDYIRDKENSIVIENALHSLTTNQRDIIDDLYLQGLSLEECRKKRGYHRNNLYLHHKRALNNLKKALN